MSENSRNEIRDRKDLDAEVQWLIFFSLTIAFLSVSVRGFFRANEQFNKKFLNEITNQIVETYILRYLYIYSLPILARFGRRKPKFNSPIPKHTEFIRMVGYQFSLSYLYNGIAIFINYIVGSSILENLLILLQCYFLYISIVAIHKTIGHGWWVTQRTILGSLLVCFFVMGIYVYNFELIVALQSLA